jgi:uroporphyrinogen decarboxylase
MNKYFSVDVEPDYEELVNTIKRNGEAKRVHFIELYLDDEIKSEICAQFGVDALISKSDPYYSQKTEIAIQRFLGYDYVRCGLENFDMPLSWMNIKDTASIAREDGRDFIDEHRGPVTSWEDFEKYPWPEIRDENFILLEWYEKHLPDDMCVIASGGFAHFAEYLSWLMGFETLCFALFENRDLISAISVRLTEIYEKAVRRFVEFDRVKLVWGSDDMGFGSGLMISPEDTREFILPGHKLMAEISHDAGRPYLLHSCGKLDMIIEDLIEDVKIDSRHSFEDNIENVVSIHKKYGHRISHLGGIDMDFLCRASQQEIRKRVDHTLEECMPIGGYCLGSGNSIANYVPLDNYLAMLDEGRKFSL